MEQSDARDRAPMGQGEPLFRRRAVAGAGDRAFGSVTAVVPPSATIGAAIAAFCAAVILAVAVLVQVPLKTDAAGVLMPAGGIVPVVAVADGRIAVVHHRESARVAEGDLMFDVAVQSAVVDGVPSSQYRLRSLRREAAQLQQAEAGRARVFEERLSALKAERDAVEARRRLVARQLAALREALAATGSRLDRYTELVGPGYVSRDELDRGREALLRDQAAAAGIAQRAAGLDAEKTSLDGRIRALQREAEVSRAEQQLRLEQLAREIDASASRTRYSIRAPQDGVVESLLGHPGSVVTRGQVLARLSRGDGALEAWLYVPSSKARSLSTGQRVELRLDAWPRSALGTRTATVYAVSAVPLAPGEVSAPLQVGGPVFEVRAILDRQARAGRSARWPIPPGTTFRTSIVQRRLPLYAWLFRNRLSPADERA